MKKETKFLVVIDKARALIMLFLSMISVVIILYAEMWPT